MDRFSRCHVDVHLAVREPPLRVVRAAGVEGVSRLFRYDVEIEAERGDAASGESSSDGSGGGSGRGAGDGLEFDDVVGKKGGLSISARWLEDAVGVDKVEVFGLVSELGQAGLGARYVRYRATIVPRVFVLTQRANCRIFQNQDLEQIVQQVLEDHGFQADQDFRFSLSESPRLREYCVQYRETDFDFISRLLEEEGVFYFFEHRDGRDVMVMGNEYPVHPDLPGSGAKVAFRPAGSLIPDEESVTDFSVAQRIRPTAVRLRDWNFEQPDLENRGSTEVRRPGTETASDLEIYEYPGRFRDAAREGRGIAQVRLEELSHSRAMGHGRGTSFRFTAGHVFELEGFYRRDFEQRYTLLEVEHQIVDEPERKEESAETHRYSNRFRGIRRDIQFRPERTTLKPSISGVQTALVVGPAGEEIYTDERGRVKVKFHWDRSDDMEEPTSWIRVAQPWAGSGFGAVFIPRIGHEVVVAFEDGDPDRPVITGAVYYDPTPCPLPADRTQTLLRTRSTPQGSGKNELRFEDKKGSEEIFLHGERNFTIVIQADKSESVGANESITIGADRTESVGGNESVNIDGNRSVTIGKSSTENVGEDVSITIGKSATLTIADHQTVDVGKNCALTVGGNVSENVAKDASREVGGADSVTVSKEHALEAKKIVLTAKDELVLECGNASITLKKNGDISIVGKGAVTIDGKDLNLKASSKAVLKSSGSADVKASGSVTIKGSQVSAN